MRYLLRTALMLAACLALSTTAIPTAQAQQKPAPTAPAKAAPPATAPAPARDVKREVTLINNSKTVLRNFYAEQPGVQDSWKNYLPSSSTLDPGESKVIPFGSIQTSGHGSCKRDLYFDFIGGGVSAQGKENLPNLKGVNICDPHKFVISGGPVKFTITAAK